MKLRSLQIHRLPGIRPGFSLQDLDPGINLVVGPNASGKSSLMRALRAVLYREELAGVSPLLVEAAFSDDRGELQVVRQGAQLTWQRGGETVDPPPLPEHRLLPCFTLRIEDLLDPENVTDAEIAGRLARDLAGGYDLGAIRGAEPFRLKQTHGQTEAKALRAAESAQPRRQQDQEHLRRDEARVAALEQQRDQAAQAAAGLERCQRALELLEARHGLALLERELAEFPPGMARLRGDELEVLEQLHDRRRDRESALRDARDALRDARHALNDTGLAETDIDHAAVADRRHALEQLRKLETTLEQRRGELHDARARRDSAVSDLGGAPGKPVHLDLATVTAVEEHLRGKRPLDAAIAALEQARDRLPPDTGSQPDPELLLRARGELLHWLAAPARPPWDARRLTAAVALAGAGLAGIVVAAITLHWALLALIVPFGWGAYGLLTGAPGERRRGDARESYRRTGEAEPQAWEPEAVQARVDELDHQAREARRRRALADERELIERRLEQRQGELQEMLARLGELAATIGYDPRIQDGPLDRWLRLALAWDEARARADALRTRTGQLEAQAGSLRSECLAFLAAHGESPDRPQPDAEALLARLEHLAGRLRQREQARRDIERAERDIRNAEGAIREMDESVVAVYRKAGLEEGDEAGLRQRLQLRTDWTQKDEELRKARARSAMLENDLRGSEELMALVADDDGQALRQRLDASRARAGRSQELNEEIGGIRKAMELAGRERALEAARATVRRARDRLEDRLAEALFAAAGSTLLDQVEAEHVQTSQPAALRRAKEWFAHFTHHDWILDFTSDGQTRFAAIETKTRERRGLAELSSGTRTQLLLAVRVAFALEAERGHDPLPLILDEALTTADPERFRAVAGSLRALAADGRQVFYLTAQPGDIGYWKTHDPDVHWVDLARARRLAGALRDPASITLPTPPAVPIPDGRSAPEYAIELGVPPVDPWGEPASLHAFHLLRDDLPLLRRLLGARIEHVGQLESLLASAAAGTLLQPAERERLKTRIAAARVWVEAWRTGRGRPVDRTALEASGAVSDTFLERMARLNEELGGDGHALLERLAAGTLRRFQTDKREALADFLAQRGYLDERQPLSADEIQMRVTAAAGSADEARMVVESLTAGMAGARS